MLFTHYGDLAVFFMFSRPSARPCRSTRVVAVILAVALATFCTPRKKPDTEDKLKAMMTQFFTVPVQPALPVAGLWIAEPASVTALIEKKYLAGYVAKPDEMQANEIRERLKSLNVFFRVQGNDLALLSIVGDSFGISPGRLKKRAGAAANAETYDAVMRGKQGSTTKAVLRLRKINGVEKIEYEENGLVMTAVREMRPAADLVAYYSQQVKAGTGLTQY